MLAKILAPVLAFFMTVLQFLGISYYPFGAKVDMSKFTLTFEEEFDGELDRSVWSGHYTYGESSSVRKGSYWNNYLAYTEDGNLIIPLKYLTEGMGGTGVGWYSAGIDTDGDAMNGFSQKYGYFEVRCILPDCPTGWAAFWLMNEGVYNEDGNGKDGTEIDIFESDCIDRRQKNAIGINLHFDGYGEAHQSMGSKKMLIKGNPYEEYNTYGLEWNENEYIFYINGVESYRTDFGGVSQNEEYLILSYELGGENAVPGFDGLDTTKEYEYIVDYVRVYQYNDLV
ncbi:MAG: glycoside hydrolase family 16 protein [Clostridia bacterium]|nr:glycoside hydrolase family 16 protein [Clostridia bacterium]